MKVQSGLAMGVVIAGLAGCAGGAGQQLVGSAGASAASNLGSVMLAGQLQGSRTVQYIGSDINAMAVTILDSGNGNATVASNVFTGASLASHLISNAFSFEVDNLKVKDGSHAGGYSYNARVDAFLDTSASVNIGSTTTSAPFTLTAGQTTSITNFPLLSLISTPVGNAIATGSNAVTVVDNPPPAIVFK